MAFKKVGSWVSTSTAIAAALAVLTFIGKEAWFMHANVAAMKSVITEEKIAKWKTDTAKVQATVKRMEKENEAQWMLLRNIDGKIEEIAIPVAVMEKLNTNLILPFIVNNTNEESCFVHSVAPMHEEIDVEKAEGPNGNEEAIQELKQTVNTAKEVISKRPRAKKPVKEFKEEYVKQQEQMAQ